MKGKYLKGNGHGVILKHDSGIRLEGLRKISKNLSQDS
jgi:hypothetical protein